MAAKATADDQPRVVPPPLNVAYLSCLQYFSWAFLTFQAAIAIYRSIDHPWNLAFIIGSYTNLLLLFFSLRRFDKARENSVERKWLRYIVWLLAASLITTFSYKTATIMPIALKVIVWAMAALATVGSFYALIFCVK